MTFTVKYTRGYDPTISIEVVRITAESFQGLGWFAIWSDDDIDYTATEIFMDEEGNLCASCPENI